MSFIFYGDFGRVIIPSNDNLDVNRELINFKVLLFAVMAMNFLFKEKTMQKQKKRNVSIRCLVVKIKRHTVFFI